MVCTIGGFVNGGVHKVSRISLLFVIQTMYAPMVIFLFQAQVKNPKSFLILYVHEKLGGIARVIIPNWALQVMMVLVAIYPVEIKTMINIIATWPTEAKMIIVVLIIFYIKDNRKAE